MISSFPNTPIVAVARAKARIALHAIASVRDESKLKVAVVSVAAVLLWIGAFIWFYEGFQWLKGFDVASGPDLVSLGDLVMLRLLAVFALALFIMLIFSNVLIVFSTAYRSREVPFLLQSPLSYGGFFLARFLECVVFSSWASAYLGSPLILAYGITTAAPWPFYIASAAFYVPFVTLPAAIGALCTIVVVRVYPHLPRGAILVGAAAVVTGLFFYFQVTFNAPEFHDSALFPGTGLPALLVFTRQTQSPWLPSTWAAQGLLLASAGRFAECAHYFLLLLANALMVTWLATAVAQRAFYRGWSWLAGRDRTRIRPYGRGAIGCLERALRRLPGPMHALIVKDIRLFWRDPTQWTQFTLFFGIMAVYVALLRHHTKAELVYFQSWITCMNIGASTLILATLTSRFVFPLISLEGRRFWVLGLAPITFRQIVWQKFWLSVATTSAFTVGLVILSCVRLSVEPVPFFLAVYSIVVTNLGLSGLAIGLGSLYPNFHEDNPARIVSGMGGTLNFLLSLGYIVAIVGAETLILQWRAIEAYTRAGGFWWALGIVLAFITVLSAACTLVPMRLGLMNLQNIEF